MSISKALSLYQPYAYAVAKGWKDWETRSFKTSYRGEILIHASKSQKSLHLLEQDPFNKYFTKSGAELWYGRIIGKVNLVDCITTEEWFDMTVKEKWNSARLLDQIGFGNYDKGRYAWKLENPVLFDYPVPAKGQLSVWNFRQCDKCGCSDQDACIKNGQTCSWATPDLCNFCANNEIDVTRNYPTFKKGGEKWT